jgi:aminotransferase
MDKIHNYISNNVKSIEISGIRKFYNLVQTVPDVISLTLGQPDFPVPIKIKEGLIKAITENKTGYTSNAGIEPLRAEISKYLKNFGISYEQEEICITVGGSEALLSTFTALLNKGDKVLVPTPGYPAYENLVKLLGGEVINYTLLDDFSIDFQNLEHLVSKHNPKVMVLSYPCNPTGAVLSKEERDRLYKIIKDNEFIVITDEIYASLCYENEYYSIAQCQDIKEKVIMISGFSKMFSMTGLRLGYVCASTELMEAIIKVHQYNVSCAPSIVQWAVLEGLKTCLADVVTMRKEFAQRRDYVYKRLKVMGFKVYLPRGAFYLFPSIDGFNMTSEEFSMSLLREAKVAVVPGSSFGIAGEGYVRLSYCYNIDTLKKALDKIEEWVNIKKNI